MSTERNVPVVRLLLFLAFVAWMSWGPFYRQALGGDNQHLREFRMYGTRARRTCQVRYEQKTPAGWERVSRWELEGFSFERFPSRGTRLLDKREQAEKAGRRLCTILGDGAELRYQRRCGHVRRGWGEWETSGDLCVDGGTP